MSAQRELPALKWNAHLARDLTFKLLQLAEQLPAQAK